MARRADPQRIHEAKAAATMQSLASDLGIPRDLAERWVAAWEAEAAERGLPRTDQEYSAAGQTWIAMRRTMQREP